MLHMQHAHVVDLLVRQHEAARQKAQREAAAKARRTTAAIAEAGPAAPARAVRKIRVHGPRPA